MKEIWKAVKNFEGLYEVSTFGRVRSLGKNITKNNHGTVCVAKYQPQILAQRYTHDGYLQVNINRSKNQNSYKVHRLVAEAFLDNPERKPFINHINGIKDDNRVENLEWVTHKENCEHAWRTGLCDSVIRGKSKPVAQKDESGKVINVFINSRRASVFIGKSLDCSRNIRKVCEKGYGHCGGYCWGWISLEEYDSFPNKIE